MGLFRQKSEASRFKFFLDAFGRITISHHNRGDFFIHEREGKNWLSTDGGSNGHKGNIFDVKSLMKYINKENK